MRVTIFAVVLVLFGALEASAEQRLFAAKCTVTEAVPVVCTASCPTGREAIDGGLTSLGPDGGGGGFASGSPIMSGFDNGNSAPSGIATGWQATDPDPIIDYVLGVWVVCGPVPTVATGPGWFLGTLTVAIVAGALLSFQWKSRQTVAA